MKTLIEAVLFLLEYEYKRIPYFDEEFVTHIDNLKKELDNL